MPTTISFVLQPGRVATLVHEENVSSIYVLQPNVLLNVNMHSLQSLTLHHLSCHVGIKMSHVIMVREGNRVQFLSVILPTLTCEQLKCCAEHCLFLSRTDKVVLSKTGRLKETNNNIVVMSSNMAGSLRSSRLLN